MISPNYTAEPMLRFSRDTSCAKCGDASHTLEVVPAHHMLSTSSKTNARILLPATGMPPHLARVCAVCDYTQPMAPRSAAA